jgi:lipopolysaccharide/colanic/teichoic acid biosynthesis glycosyltransferase
MKRIADICLVLISLPGVLPLIVALAILIALQGGRPFYYQDRIGQNGRIFRMWKFRTMIRDAKEALAYHLESDPLALAEWESTQKLKSDPRITRIGRILRKSSLDELPQLWNVLKGDMSLVGPRPMMPEQVSLYPGKAYYALRPGITGLWQVSKRNDGCFADRAHFDTEYERTVSLGTDIRLLLATVAVVLRGTGY